ncbi:tRNA pseudouridine(38-40) synthase TruA [Sandaracinus amylolyticus]|uniref:tRNA pseudouridine(38-40) synthase TruA n=1 Tax=Sandaracinus amylolyticus TaxID=927083 RepID=UPI001F0062BD|nr:tRNA pseudouridine(38-40) synthase TruA [Sandaracinus amylolyticus]UJR80301.1 tRNA pseudouridine synthase A [Sandaracinus amylolyticus]
MLHGVRLTIAYDGAGFAGWARQPGTRTVQGTLEAAIASMNGAPVELRGASRTDAGVHAMGQVAAFDAARTIEPRGWLRGLNAALPDDAAIVAAEACEAGYTPRFDTVDKTYRYLILRGDVRDPLLRGRAWFLGPRHGGTSLDVGAMRAIAKRLEGTHDFRAFRSADDDRENTVRTIHEIAIHDGWGDEPRLVAIEVRGNAFMKNMVRILVGTLVEAGRGRLAERDAGTLIGADARRDDTGQTAPAHGLTLVSMRLGRARA